MRSVTQHSISCTATGIKLLEKRGFVEAEQLIEDLVPFMDAGPKVSGAFCLHSLLMTVSCCQG